MLLASLAAIPAGAAETCVPSGPVSLMILQSGQKVRELAIALGGQVVAAGPKTVILADGRVITADPERERAYYYCARALAMAGADIERGLECAQHYVEHCTKCDDSDRGYGWWRRATLYRRKGETDAAVAAYREALRLNPELDGARQGLEELER